MFHLACVCSVRLDVPEARAGQALSCPSCGRSLRVPTLATPPRESGRPSPQARPRGLPRLPAGAFVLLAGLAAFASGLWLLNHSSSADSGPVRGRHEESTPAPARAPTPKADPPGFFVIAPDSLPERLPVEQPRPARLDSVAEPLPSVPSSLATSPAAPAAEPPAPLPVLTLPELTRSAPAQRMGGLWPLACDALQVTLDSERRNDLIVERFILYDTHQLPGPLGREAHTALTYMGPDGLPAVLRGLSRSARMQVSCPIMVLSQKAKTLLQRCNSADAVRWARLELVHEIQQIPPQMGGPQGGLASINTRFNLSRLGPLGPMDHVVGPMDHVVGPMDHVVGPMDHLVGPMDGLTPGGAHMLHHLGHNPAALGGQFRQRQHPLQASVYLGHLQSLVVCCDRRLMQLQEGKGEQIGGLILALEDPSPATRRDAANALGCYALEGCFGRHREGNRLLQRAITGLAEAMQDTDAGVRGLAARALACLGPDAAPSLIQMARYGQLREARVLAFLALAESTPITEETAGFLTTQAREGDADSRAAARLALRRMSR